MKPVVLHIKAFGPFAGEEKIGHQFVASYPIEYGGLSKIQLLEIDSNYTINGAAGQTPKLLGQWQAQGQTSPSPTLTASQQDAGDANLPLLVNELSKRPTMQQLIDARPGSVIITAGTDNNARIRLKMETSENLQNWTVTPESQANPLEVVQPLTGNKRFFRFSLSD
jgi:hypothetical protein